MQELFEAVEVLATAFGSESFAWRKDVRSSMTFLFCGTMSESA